MALIGCKRSGNLSTICSQNTVYEWAITNNLYINTDKTTTTLFTPDPAEYGTTL